MCTQFFDNAETNKQKTTTIPKNNNKTKSILFPVALNKKSMVEGTSMTNMATFPPKALILVKVKFYLKFLALQHFSMHY